MNAFALSLRVNLEHHLRDAYEADDTGTEDATPLELHQVPGMQEIHEEAYGYAGRHLAGAAADAAKAYLQSAWDELEHRYAEAGPLTDAHITRAIHGNEDFAADTIHALRQAGWTAGY